ncbi:chemotaxis protein CheB [Flavobacterium frigoris]|uniref:protein-glutamate O-methyltransferase n=1 Tax=Flavobacterium frigoris (strain PS1) TaxID=1086011 RepID=H7FTI9_FLAFP|nr:chemotaxis protein CheB [Flavobacterium frigoris]EIA08468.1 chemotaxis protein methyltransferase CheR [Flavobacterium frigoris PS1]
MKIVTKDSTNNKHDQISKEHSKSNVPNLEDEKFPIVGIGASAGGLESFELFFKNLPIDTGMAFVIIQHLDPTHEGVLPELIQRKTGMIVLQASDRLKVKPNHVYVIPPNKSLSILNGTLHLFDPLETRGLRLPIDIFFRSLAADRKENSVGIILSGMGSDGSLGIRAIKEQNGLVMVQDPSSAKFDSMPSNAIRAVSADIIATVEELPAKLINFLKFLPAEKIKIESKSKSSIDKIIILLRDQSGHDFSMYKKSTLMRRIERRIGIYGIEDLDKYVRFLQNNPSEVELLFNELLIGVTSFFRDTEVWQKLKGEIFPEYIKSLPDNYVLRAWVTACSTGEEAYSLAILFREIMNDMQNDRGLSLQIFASDLDVHAIEKARKGLFSSNIVADVSEERINKNFKSEVGGFRVNSDIREMLIFAPHDLIKDPPFTKLDILTCRNMLIYMEPPLQKKMMALFNYSLNPGGIMVLGTAETLGQNNSDFEIIDSRLKFFKKTKTSKLREFIDFPSSFTGGKRKSTMTEPTPKITENIQTFADQILLQRFAPASVMVNENGDILYITGRTGKYLEPVAGKANWNIHAMAREGLRNVLPSAFRKAKKTFEPVVLSKIKIGSDGSFTYVDVTLQCIESPAEVKGMIMIVFNELPKTVGNNISNIKSNIQSGNDEVKELEAELKQSNIDLQIVREEMQTSQEELKSSNEELQSTNEELQSTNEELTTSKEEMQSLNEELQTINAELQSKLIDFELANNDMKNLLNSTDIATLFLDMNLNIRRFTEPVCKIFKLRSSDVGRPFTDLVTELEYPELKLHAQEVIKNLTSIQTKVTTKGGKWFYVKIMPYRTLDDRIDGLVITFIDISLAKKAEETLNYENRYLRLFESAKDGIIILNAENGKIIDVNPFLIVKLGYSYEQFMEKTIWEIGMSKDIKANKAKFLELQKENSIRYENLPLETATGEIVNVEFVSNVFTVNNNKIIQCIVREIADKKKSKAALLATPEPHYRQLFESIDEGVLFIDADAGKIIDINKYLIDLLGYPKEYFHEHRIWDKEFFKAIVPNKNKFLELQQREFIHYENVPIKIANGTEIYIDFTSNIYFTDYNKIIQCFIHQVDKPKVAKVMIDESKK